MNLLISLALVAGLFLMALAGAAVGLEWALGIVLPYLAVCLFVSGLVYRVMAWASVPVPFRIPTTCGQQKSLPWLGHDRLENPAGTWSVVGRMALEVLFFRSLLRNTRSDMVGRRLVYGSDLWLWAGAMAMHWGMAVVLFRHLRLVTEPVPGLVTFVSALDGFLEVGLPVLYVTSLLFVGGLVLLLLRRLTNPLVRYISLVGDYFPLVLLLGIGGSGLWLRHLTKTDVAAVKELMLGLVHFSPTVPDSIDPLFYGHLLLVCALLAYFPLGKLVHMAGVFLSPTRNLANNNRAVHHENPWNHPVDVHSYDEYEDELREKMVKAGLPVERPLEDQPPEALVESTPAAEKE